MPGAKILGRIAGFLSFGALCAFLAAPVAAQAERGKAELKVGSGSMTVDYGRPSLKGRDMLSKLEDGAVWRMGMNEATVFTTPVDLSFGKTQVAKGSYSLWLKKEGAKYMLVFNSQTGQWGTNHDPSKDVHSVEMTSASLPSPVETFTIDLKGKGNGGDLDLAWGATKLSSAFVIAK
jgi:hypothetical protein